MSEPRLSPSQLEEIEKSLTRKPIRKSDWPAILLLREIRACWADLAAASEAMRANSDEMDLLRAIAIAVAEEEALSTATDSAAFAALRDWQKWKRGE